MPTTTDTERLKAQNNQRKAAKEKVYATFESLSGKPKAVDEFTVVLDPEQPPVTLLFEACGAEEYDALLTKYQPTMEQKARGMSFNPKTFPPALLAVVCQEPKLTMQQWQQVIKGDNWSTGDAGILYDRAIQLCIRGLDPNPTEAG